MILVKIALRNLRRNLRRSILTIGSIAFGLATMLWLESVMASRNDELIETVTNLQSGHLLIQNENYARDRSLNLTFKPTPEQTAHWKSLLPPNAVMTDRIYFGVILSSGEQSSPLIMTGVEPDTEAQVTILKQKTIAGEYLTADPDPTCPSRQIFIGKALAEYLNVEVGSKVVLLGAAADGTLGNDLFRVQGIYDTQSRDFDKSMAYTPLTCLAKVAAIDGIHERVIRLPDLSSIESTYEKLRTQFTSPLKLYSWIQLQARFAMALKYNDASIALFSGLLLVVIIFGTMNTLFMSIFERTRELGLMTALGTLPYQMSGIIVIEGALLGLISTVLGFILGVSLILYHRQVGFDLRPFIGENAIMGEFKLTLLLYPKLEFLPFIRYILVVNGVVILSSIFPALRVARMNTIEAIRNPT